MSFKYRKHVDFEYKNKTQIISNFAKSKHKVLGQMRKTENDVIIYQTNIFPTVEL